MGAGLDGGASSRYILPVFYSREVRSPDDTPTDPDDPHAAEDAAYEERARQHRERVMATWRARQGLVRLNGRPARLAVAALRRSLPSFRDASHLFDLVEAGLGERAERDPWATPNERCLLLRDPEHPSWYLPRRLIYLQEDYRAPDPLPMHVELPERIKRIVARQKAKEPPPAPKEEVVVPLSPGGRPGRLCVYEGPAYVDLTFGERGELGACMMTAGDPTSLGAGDEPFTLDPELRSSPPPPLSLLLQDEALGEGVGVEVLAALVLGLHPERADRGRVHLPAVQPGTVTGAWTRGLWNLREAEWAGRVPDEPGWLLIDAWNGAAVTTGPTLPEAFAAWQALVREVQPLPPVEAPAAEVPEPEPPEPPEPAAAPREDVVVAATGMIRLELHPPVRLDWPTPRPEHVPAVAVPVPARPPVPPSLVALGFTRTLRLFGEHGETGHAWIREDPEGLTVIGDDALPVLVLDTLEADLDRIDARTREEWVDWGGRGNPWTNPQYPVHLSSYRVRDDTCRRPELRQGQMSWQGELAPRGWGIEHRHLVTRVRQVLVRANRRFPEEEAPG